LSVKKKVKKARPSPKPTLPGDMLLFLPFAVNDALAVVYCPVLKVWYVAAGFVIN
jgi:hypothetical protein